MSHEGHSSCVCQRAAAAAALILSLLFMAGCLAPGRLEAAMRARPEQFSHILGCAQRMRVQVLVSSVNERRGGPPTLRRYGFRVDQEYFYPASAIKACAAIAALETIADLEARHMTGGLADAPLRIAPLFEGDAWQILEPSNLAGGRITVAHEVRKLALVSDNPAFNRLFDLCGYDDLHDRMRRAGLASVVINHRLSDPRSIADQRTTAQVTIFGQGATIDIPARQSRRSYTNHSPGLAIGDGYLLRDEFIPVPMDFTRRNGISLVDLQDMLIMLVRPDIPLGKRGFTLREDHRAMLIEAMTQAPRESENPLYDPGQYPDHYAKFLLPGLLRTGPADRWRITNKIGRAYGFSVENACVHDLHTGDTVFITAVIYTNADGVLNDDKYEYVQTADPFMADLAHLVVTEFSGLGGTNVVR